MRIETDRLILRPFVPEDTEPFARMNADPEVTRYFPAPLTAEQTDEMLARFAEKRARVGYAFSAVELKETGALIGMAGLSLFEADTAIAPIPEIGWRLTPRAWGKGYASEAALAWLAQAFGPLNLPKVIAYTAPANTPSAKVMERIGMTRRVDLDFDHPKIAQGHPLRRCIVYAISRDEWRVSQASGGSPVTDQ